MALHCAYVLQFLRYIPPSKCPFDTRPINVMQFQFPRASHPRHHVHVPPIVATTTTGLWCCTPDHLYTFQFNATRAWRYHDSKQHAGDRGGGVGGIYYQHIVHGNMLHEMPKNRFTSVLLSHEMPPRATDTY